MDENNKKRSFSEVLKELMESSSVHGIPKIASSRQVAVKVMWCILMVAGFCVLTVQLVALFRTFQSHPVQTTVSLDFSTLRFPAISFCNMNPVRKSKIGMSTQLRDTVFPKKKKYSLAAKDTEETKLNEDKRSKARKRRQLGDLLSLNVSLHDAADTGSNAFLGDNDTIGIHRTNMTVFDATNVTMNENVTIFTNETIYDENFNENFTDVTNETVIDSPYESSSFAPFTYDYNEHYVWDIFSYHEYEDSFNYTSMNFSQEYVDISLAEHYQDPKDKWEMLITKFRVTYRNVSVEKRKRMGHQRQDFIQYASFARREQNVSKYFEGFTTTDYGNCYTMTHPRYKAWGSGPDSGIKLTLYLEVDEYIENFSSGYGVRIVFHEPGTFPMPAEEGLTLSPGYETSIGLRAINVTRLGEPYGDCTHDGEHFKKKYNITYSKTACLVFCRVENVIRECGCVPYDAPDIDFRTKRPICGSRDWDEYCVDYVDNIFEKGNLDCDCISPCSEFVYSKTMSGRVWPHRDYLEKVLMKDICEKNLTSLMDACAQIKNETTDFNYERYKNNFVRVLIYFEDLNYEKITEEPFYTPVRFVSDIGGAAGLFMGISVLSFFEVLQLILEIILHLFDRNTNPPNKDDLLKKT